MFPMNVLWFPAKKERHYQRKKTAEISGCAGLRETTGTSSVFHNWKSRKAIEEKCKQVHYFRTYYRRVSCGGEIL